MEVFNLNIRPGKTCPVIHCSQFDKGRTFRANLYDGSEVFTLTAAETLSVIEKKSDGNMVTIGVTNTSDSYVEFATTEQMTALAGPQICELRIVEGDTLIGSANFILDCEESPDTGIESESEIHNLETQIQDINEQIVPDMVAEEVENQYDSQNVIFDDTPTENHGTGYAVTSEGVKNALDGKPDNLSDLGDVDISSPTSNQALVYNPTTQKWENGEVSTVGSIDDLDDVDTTGKAEGDSLRYNGTKWVAQPTTVKLTLAKYNALTEKAPNTRYIIIDAPALEYTADDLSYDGGTETTKQKIDEKANKTQNAIFTPESGVSVMHISSGYTNKQCCISAEIRFTGSANAWKTLGTLSIAPNDACQVIGINTGTGTLIGIVRLRDTGVVEVYPTSAISNAAVGFSISFVKS